MYFSVPNTTRRIMHPARFKHNKIIISSVMEDSAISIISHSTSEKFVSISHNIDRNDLARESLFYCNKYYC